MPQLSVQPLQPQWLAEGQYASTRTRSVEGAVENFYADGFVPFGRVAILDPIAKTIKALSATPTATDMLVVPVLTDRHGVSIDDLIASSLPDIGYPDGELVEYESQGDIVMWSENGGVYGIPLFFRHAAGAAPNNKIGRVRKDADGANTTTRSTIRFAETKTTSGLIAVRIMTSFSL